MTSDVWIVGVGMTPFKKHPALGVKELTAWAVHDSFDDAGCHASSLKAAYFGNCGQGRLQQQQMIRGHVALMPLGIQGVPIVNVESACATASVAFHLAVQGIRGGADVALAVGVEKLCIPDRAAAFALFESAWDVESADKNGARLANLGAGVEIPPGSRSERPYSSFLDIYAAYCRYHQREYGLTQRQLAVVSSKNHGHAVHNERAQYRDALTVEDVLAAPPITWPLTLPMCSPLSDGAAAAVLMSDEGLRRHGIDRRRAVRVAASVLRSGSGRDWIDLDRHITRLGALQAYEEASLSPTDMDVAEVHDATAMGEILQCENLGLCDRGSGGSLAESGATRLGGRLPVNPSGGLESNGHPIGATGLGQIFELVSQLRGECGARQVRGARHAIQENGGGLWHAEEASAHVAILARSH